MQIKPLCPGGTRREYISKAEHVSVACSNVSVTNAGYLSSKANVCGGGIMWKMCESELKKKSNLAT